MSTTENSNRIWVSNFPAHMILVSAPWPVPGVCEWLGGCTEPKADGVHCAGHGAYIRELTASAAKSWSLAGAR